MITIPNIENSIKELARRTPSSDLSHCQNIDHYIQKLGFNNRHHLKTYLSAQKPYSPIFTQLAKAICAIREPSTEPYGALEFVEYRTGYRIRGGYNVDVHDIWLGLDADYRDVRIPSGDFDAKRVVPYTRNDANTTIYVIENLYELQAWEKHKWQGMAVVSFTLIQTHYKHFFASEGRLIEGYDGDHARKVIQARTEIRRILGNSGLTIHEVL